MNYQHIIDEMTWSYSRLSQYNQCPYGFFLKYLKEVDVDATFFASYGSMMHELFAKYLNHECEKGQCPAMYIQWFMEKVAPQKAPSAKVYTSYFNDGLNCARNLQLDREHAIAVESRFGFRYADARCIGIADLLQEEDGKLILTDHKARALKQRSKRAKPTLNDQEIDKFMRQLYMYSKAVHNRFGRFPDELRINCYRNGVLIKEPFRKEKYEEAECRFADGLERVRNEEEWAPHYDWFWCNHLCDVRSSCIYADMQQPPED